MSELVVPWLLLLPQFHDGVNFLTSHVVITNTFEYSLQKVNPKISVPYWDWTIEEYEAEKKGAVSDMGGLMIDSPLFQESWFGTADPDDYKARKNAALAGAQRMMRLVGNK